MRAGDALSRKSVAHADGASNRPVQWYFDNLLPAGALRTVIAREADSDNFQQYLGL